ncbi:hypothetical protein NQZ68_040844 [Dissostichus eleginoides]|nr:hypothetical protein NQZ68_040844 [Dissostichus eleginoides]
MKGLSTLLLLCSTALLCSAAPAVEPVTCSEDGGAAAARMAAHHIDENHDHGYKFKLSEIKGNKVEKVDDGCEIELQLDLMETTCHNINPKHFEDCMIRGETQRAVMANCSVRIHVTNGDAKVRNYHCDTRQVKTDSEMVSICPDCPNLISLHDPDGMKSVKEAVQRVNENTTNQNYFILKDVGRIKIGWMMTGMNYWAEIALVESNCPMGSRILPEACKPFCPDRARHALCRSSYSKSKGLITLLPSAMVSGSPYVDTMVVVALLTMMVLVVKAVLTMMVLVVAALLTVMVLVVVALLTMMVLVVMDLLTAMVLVVVVVTALLTIMVVTMMVMVVVALLPLLVVMVALLTKKGSVIGPHSTASTAMDRTQLSTPFAPGPVLSPAAPAAPA